MASTPRKRTTNVEDVAKEGATGIRKLLFGTGIAGILGVLILLGQLSGGIKLLGDWTAQFRQDGVDDYIHEQDHDILDALRDHFKQVCRDPAFDDKTSLCKKI